MEKLVSGDTNGLRDVYLFRRSTGVTTRISQLPAGSTFNTNFNGSSKSPVISASGKIIAFETNASNVPGYPASSVNTVVVYNTVSGTFSIAPLGTFNTRLSGYLPDLSANGSKLTYSSRAGGIVSSPPATGSVMQVYQYDIATGNNTMVSVMPDGTAGQLDSKGSRNSDQPRPATAEESGVYA